MPLYTEHNESTDNTKQLYDDCRLITCDDSDFPFLLKKIPVSPSLQPRRLFVAGDLPSCAETTETKFLCIVGSRKYTSYGKEACEYLVRGLAGYNICIVSGLAIGIDSIAHEAALDVGLSTIAFPGSGLSPQVMYPARNQRLAERIKNTPKCALLSEFDMDFHAIDWGFPLRNRLMAGISHATLVIEAGIDSGTLITSRLAGDYNRDVFAVPGQIFSPLSAGPNMLISKGAAIIRSSSDILDALGIKARTDDTGPPESGLVETKLSPKEKIILDILIEPLSRDDFIRTVCERLNCTVAHATSLISLMELSSVLVEEAGMIRRKI